MSMVVAWVMCSLGDYLVMTVGMGRLIAVLGDRVTVFAVLRLTVRCTVVSLPPSVDVSCCKHPLVLNVANFSRETTPLLRSPHSDLRVAVLNEGFHCTALHKFCVIGGVVVKSIVNISNRGSNIENRTEN